MLDFFCRSCRTAKTVNERTKVNGDKDHLAPDPSLASVWRGWVENLLMPVHDCVGRHREILFFMTQNSDLLGDPISENWGKRGRPPHIPAAENQAKVSMLCAFGWDNERIFKALHKTPRSRCALYFSQYRLEASWQDRSHALTSRRLSLLCHLAGFEFSRPTTPIRSTTPRGATWRLLELSCSKRTRRAFNSSAIRLVRGRERSPSIIAGEPRLQQSSEHPEVAKPCPAAEARQLLCRRIRAAVCRRGKFLT